MSWTGIKKAINRVGTQVMLKTGQIDQTVDKEFEYEEKKFRDLETTSINLQKELQVYFKTLKNLTNSQLNISKAVLSFYDDQKNYDKLENTMGSVTQNNLTHHKEFANGYFQIMSYLNNQCLSDLETPYCQTVLNPVSKFNSYYVEINEAIKKRSRKQIDYDFMKSKVKKLAEKSLTGSNINNENKYNEYNEQLKDLKKSYEFLNTQIISELPKLISLRIPFLDPTFESFVKIQLRFFNESYFQLNNLQSILNSKVRYDYINGNLEKKIDDTLNKMNELNIISS